MKYTIKNFKKFGQQGVTFDFAPITLLTGCNCSGKSSLVKSLMLLGDYFEKVRNCNKRESNKDIIIDQPLAFNDSNHKLGGYSTTINDKSKDETIYFSYSKYSELLHENVIVTLSFENNQDNQLVSEGKLKEITFKLENGEVFYRGERGRKGRFCHKLINLSVIRNIYMEEMYQAILELLDDDMEDRETLYPNEVGGYENWKKYQRYRKLIPGRITYLKKSIPLKEKCHTKMHQLCKKVLDVDYRVFNDDNILALKKHKTVFYLPWFDILKDVEKSDVRFVIKEKLKGSELSENLKFNLDFLLTAFENSEYDSFCDYVCKVEDESLKFQFSEYSRDLFSELVAGIGKGDLTTFGYSFSSDRFNEKIEINKLFEVLAEAYLKIDDSFGKFVTRDEFDCIHFPNVLYDCFMSYFSLIWEEVLVEDVPCFISKITYVGSERAIAKRFYSLEHENADLCDQIQQFVDLKNKIDDEIPNIKDQVVSIKKSQLNKQCDEGVLSKGNKEQLLQEFENEIEKEFCELDFVDSWLKKLGIGEAFCVEKVKDSIGATIGYSISITKNGKKYSIVDEGYGCVQIISVLLAVQNTIFKFFINNTSLFLHCDWKNNPIINGQVEYCVIIEEPENHLHPRLQSLLADIFLEAHRNFGINFIIETHSEYIIRKSQVLVSRMGFETNNDSDTKSPFKTYYIPEKGNPYSLGYRKDGKFAESFGPGFYDEAANLTFDIM